MQTINVLLVTSFIIIASTNAFLVIKDGYFWDPNANSHWIPRGISYQTFNQDIGQWTTYEQIGSFIFHLFINHEQNMTSVR